MESLLPATATSELDLVLNLSVPPTEPPLLHIRVVPPKEGPRKPCAIICVVDTSGSMNEASMIEDTGEKTAYSRLDLVKHSVKTTVHMLGPGDYFALVSFDNQPKVVLPLQEVTEGLKMKVADAMTAMVPDGSTNIGDALVAGLNVAAGSICEKMNTSVWLFTDGQSNVNPNGLPEVIVKKYLEGHTWHPIINTFGFGYDLDSNMLMELSELGKGVYGFTPDCNFMGTIFVNGIANTLAVVESKATIKVVCEGVPSAVPAPLPKLSVSEEKLPKTKSQMRKEKKKKRQLKAVSKSAVDADGLIHVGNIQYGQPRDFIVGLQVPKATVKLTYGGKTVTKTVEGETISDKDEFHKAYCRNMYCELLVRGLKFYKADKSTEFLTRITEIIKGSPVAGTDDMKALLKDIISEDPNQGRVSKAFSDLARFERWGGHYVRSIVRAHQMQQCHNFKDPGVQLYGGKLFKDLQDKAEMVFCSLPAPVGSLATSPKAAPAAAAAPDPVAPSMDYYYNCSGGCFDGNGEILLADGTKKLVKEVVAGDSLATANGKAAVKVKCVVRFEIKRTLEMICLNGLLITPKHPVRVSGKWVKPSEIGKPRNQFVDYIYNFVLESGHVATINGVEVVTLGHEMREAGVAHLYYGTQKVVRDLQKMTGWDQGKVVVKKLRKLRDPFNGTLMRLEGITEAEEC